MNKLASIADGNDFYKDFTAVGGDGKPAAYELKDGEKIIPNAPVPNFAVDGVLYDESSMLFRSGTAGTGLRRRRKLRERRRCMWRVRKSGFKNRNWSC